MQLSLDIGTIFVVLALAHLANVCFSFGLWLKRWSFAGAGAWVLGQVLILLGMAAALWASFSSWPFVGRVLGNGATLAGLLCMLEAIWRFRFGRPAPRLFWAALPVYLVILVALVDDSLNQRIVAYSAANSLGTLACGLALVIRPESRMRVGSWMAGLGLLIMVPAHLFRAGIALFGPPVGSLLDQGPLGALIYLVSIFSAWLLLFGYITLSRLRREAELERLNQANLFLISVLSHDLRAPLKSAARFVEHHLLAGHADLNQRRDALAVLGKALASTGVLLDQLLDWAQEQRDPDAPLRMEQVPLDELVQPALGLVAEELLSHSLTINYQPGRAVLRAERRLASAVLRNLLSNAVRHLPPGSAISIASEASPGERRVLISDNGPGIPPHVLERLRSGGAVPRLNGNAEEVGTSLGLSMCKRFMERQGGRLEIVSEPGKGTRFILAFAED